MKKLEISKEDLKYNLDIIKEKANNFNTKIFAVVKANGMGLDLVQYSKFLIENGIQTLAVSDPLEAILLRNSQIQKDILMLSEISNEKEIKELIDKNIILTIGSLEEKQKIQQIASSMEKKVRAHIKIDTGFARYRFYL